MSEEALARYFSVMAERGHRPGNLRFELETIFDGIEFAGRSVLDIGAGAGSTSLYAACAGAERVVGLEPEAAGSRAGMRTAFERARDRLGARQVVLRPETVQELDPGDERFDVLISKASINHFDEAACIRLHREPGARRAYREILGRISDLANPGADLVVSDCSRHNLFARIGIPNPLVPAIEWEKHQPPQLWAELLVEVGFRDPRIRWMTFNSLRRAGRILLGNRVAAYLTTSDFCLTMKRA